MVHFYYKKEKYKNILKISKKMLDKKSKIIYNKTEDKNDP